MKIELLKYIFMKLSLNLSFSLCMSLFIISCNNPLNENNSGNNGGNHNDSCGFGILTVVNNSWNNYQVFVDSIMIFTVKMKSSNGGPVQLGNHNFKVGTPIKYVVDTTFFVNDCITYTLYCENYLQE